MPSISKATWNEMHPEEKVSWIPARCLQSFKCWHNLIHPSLLTTPVPSQKISGVPNSGSLDKNTHPGCSHQPQLSAVSVAPSNVTGFPYPVCTDTSTKYSHIVNSGWLARFSKALRLPGYLMFAGFQQDARAPSNKNCSEIAFSNWKLVSGNSCAQVS